MKTSIKSLWSLWLILLIFMASCATARTPVSSTVAVIPTDTFTPPPTLTRTVLKPTASPTRTITPVPLPTDTPGPTETPANFVTQAVECQNNAKTTLDMNSCAAFEKTQYEKLLNQLILDLKTILRPEQAVEFDAVQRKWQTYVKADCDWHLHLYQEGTMRTIVEITCYTSHYKERINSLKWLLCGDESDCEAQKKYDNFQLVN